jgi:putative ABC transport system permease protein
MNNYFKQSLQILKENPLVSVISILGTALSIAMILVIVLVFQINNAGYAPESHRNRMLYVLATDATNETTNVRGYMSSEVAKECFYTLQKPEAVTAIATGKRPVSLPGMRLFKEWEIKYTDAGFWKVFDFTFLQGVPFSDADFQSGISRAVISAQLAMELFGTTDATGKNFLLESIPYTVSGVVKTVSQATNLAFADIWIPYSTKQGLLYNNSMYGGMNGQFQTVILAKNTSDFEAIREELKQQTARYNEGKSEFKVSFIDNPLTRLDLATGSTGFEKMPLRKYLLNTGSLLLFLLLIPALNLIGVIQASVRKRQGEIGVRKAFGATRGKMVQQILFENLVTTGVGGLLGLALSFAFLWIGKSFLLTETTLLTADMLFRPGLFAAVLFFVLLLNLLSAGIPALQISRRQIVETLKETE